MTINQENARMWVQALRSGNFQQGRGALHRDNMFCCLGVACEISGVGQWLTEPMGAYGTRRDRNSATLPLSVAEWLGVSRSNPYVTMDEKTAFLMNQYVIESAPMVEDPDANEYKAGDMTTLAALNDSGKFSFSDIADMIEAQYIKEEA